MSCHGLTFSWAGAIPARSTPEKIYDATACLALERFTASMESMLIPRTLR
jgi:hypothetical protein